ncbi:MAG TPA: HAD family hydrolase, partial [Fibrobacteria bacterium]|nr:HAD family hydrolase [Fibrobacteria bacterium]
MDGTLLNPDGRLPEGTALLLRNLAARGVHIV